ncbi:MAG: Hsp20/alpha crystallin family protein [Gammaproteobacteria bacterium]|nr:Hsp20/alpha crystallin family protein [Gammaproteobacteria bacterium]
MTMIRYQPWRSLGDLHSELSRLFDAQAGGIAGDDTVACDWVPAVDVREETDRFVVHADLPGVDPRDIEITMEDGVLTVRGERKTEATVTKEGYRRVERSAGLFYRRFSLPDTVDSEGVKASGNNGVLEIAIPKLAKVQPRRIQVDVDAA